MSRSPDETTLRVGGRQPGRHTPGTQANRVPPGRLSSLGAGGRHLAESYAIWRSRPVFVTSTFRDMHAERDYLHDHVFPELVERLRERFHHLEPVDLGWGVSEEAAANQMRCTGRSDGRAFKCCREPHGVGRCNRYGT